MYLKLKRKKEKKRVNSDRRKSCHNIRIISFQYSKITAIKTNKYFINTVYVIINICRSINLIKHDYFHVNMVKLLDKPTGNVVKIHVLCIAFYKLIYTYVKTCKTASFERLFCEDSL